MNTLEKYAELDRVNTLPEPVFSIGLIPLVCPAENCVDGSLDAVSVYAPAVGLIHNINRNEAQLNIEFENGESRIIVPHAMLRKMPDGTKGITDHVFVGLNSMPDDGEKLTVFSPALREQSFITRKTEYLRNIEGLIGFKRGLLSEVEAAERTATEITSSAGEYNLTVIDFQQAWEKTVREAVRVCNLLGQIYKLTGSGVVDPERDISISWGNGILYDEDKEWSTLMSMVSAGILKPEIAVAWQYDLPWETPEDLAVIREKYMPNMEGTAEDGDESC